MKFTNKIIVITGGASGIGEATAVAFAKKGGIVYVLDKKAPLEKHENLNYLECDVQNFASIQAAVAKVCENSKRIDVLFANAGIHLFGNIEETKLEEIDLVLNVNLRGVLYALKAVIPVMKAQGSGSIVLTGSDQSLVGKEKSCVYGATKAAIAQLAKSTALDYAKYNIRVNCICPGSIDTPMLHTAVDRFIKLTNTPKQEILDSLHTAQPIQRLGTPAEIANTVMFLCSDKASYITGAALSVDGGYTAR